jgi:hypothetical protein
MQEERLTLYMVQHAFSRPDWEDEWNAWYAGNLKVLLGVQGLRTGQRFKALDGAPPRYMAVYTVDSPDVFESKAYKDAGGGGTNSQRFRPAYQVWTRNLFEGMDSAPPIREGEYLVCVDSAAADVDLPGVHLTWMPSTGFHKTTPFRALGVVTEEDAVRRLRGIDGVTVYQPISAQQGPLY